LYFVAPAGFEEKKSKGFDQGGYKEGEMIQDNSVFGRKSLPVAPAEICEDV
jgi:hypothetical protein